MREILFRGKRIKTEEWIEGCFVYGVGRTGMCPQIIVTDPESELYGNHDIDFQTLGQFTELIDKNGVKIFEGDVVSVHVFTQELGENYGVYEGEKQFNGLVEFGVTGLTVKANGFKDQIWFYENFHEESLEVIGNVFDNPDLLTKTESE